MGPTLCSFEDEEAEPRLLASGTRHQTVGVLAEDVLEPEASFRDFGWH